MLGYILEFNKSSSTGIVVDSEGKHYNFNKSGMPDYFYFDPFDNVSFEIDDSGETWLAINLQLIAYEEECAHEFDMDEGGMCLNCGADDYYNYIDEDYGSER